MLTLFYIFLVLAVLVFAGIIALRRLSANPVEKFDPERELYRQLLKSARARARSDERYDPEWELYQQRYD
jgi:hypothetical protein